MSDKHKSIYLKEEDKIYMDKKIYLVNNNFFSNILIKLILKFPKLGKLIGVQVK